MDIKLNVSKLFVFSIIFLLTYEKVCGYRILGIFPHIGKSHSYAFEPLLRELAEKGHEVTVISHFPLENPPKTYKDISLKGSLPIWISSFDFEYFHYAYGLERIMKHVFSAKNLFLIGSITCKAMLDNEGVKAIKEGDYDIALIEQFNSDCGLGIVHKFNIPFIGVTSHVMMAWTTGRLGIIDNPSYVPSHYLEYGRKPNMLQTAESFLIGNWYKLIYYVFSQIPERQMLKEYYGNDLPALEDIARNMSLILINTYYPLLGAVPLSPNAVEIGGLHLQKKRQLDPDLENYLNSSKNGVVLFSMGSMLRAISMPPERLKALQDAFSEIDYDILWKWENDTMEGIPKNVKIMKWIPQLEVLSHKNVKAFISHCGMLGLTETVHCGVPVVCIPIYGDQFGNAAAARDSGVGAYLSYKDIAKESVLTALRQVLGQRVQAESKRLSAIWMDRPLSPLDTAVFWVEHVARHGGRHLRPVVADLPIYRFLLLDVLLLLFVVNLVFMWVVYKCCYVKCCGSSKYKLKGE